MSNTNSYIVFEPDQVLTSDHLNNLFEYLDTQERLTRNKLIGIGIACGLEISFNSANTSIIISKGCGVTSYGYLIWPDLNKESDTQGANGNAFPGNIFDVPLTQFTSYTLPADPLYKHFVNKGTGKQFDLWQLLTDEQATATEGTVSPLSKFPTALNEMIVVLFLEMTNVDLKNCDTDDCDDKGIRREFKLRPLLIRRADMDTILAQDTTGAGSSYQNRLSLKEIALRRFDVTATSISDPFDIFNAYVACLNDTLLSDIAGSYIQCWNVFKPLLDNYAANPFVDMYKFLTERLATIQQSLPIYIQYYYDFIDDLLKAYNEFRDRGLEVITECCPDEEMFPLHLMLGRANVNTSDYEYADYRQYFIYSPLVNNQLGLVNEVKLLFDRMVTLRNNFFVRLFDGRTVTPVRITPSKWGDAPLSERAIPYYYNNIDFIEKSWNYQKTRKGKANYNLSYASQGDAASPDSVRSPLLYGIEPYNFFRIEGHIGQSYDAVLKSITDLRNFNRLPFDVIALKAGDDASDTFTKLDCNFQDLQAMYDIIKSELACKAHEPVCLVAKMPSSLQISTQPNAPFNFLSVLSNTHTMVLNDQINLKTNVVSKFLFTYYSNKGAFLKANCPIGKGTLAEEYSNSIRKYFPRPAKIDLTTAAGSKAALLHLIDTVEELMLTVSDTSLYYFDYDTFNKQYDETISYFKDFSQAILDADKATRTLSPFLYDTLESIIYSCVDEKFKALINEYNDRVTKIKKMNLFSEYILNNPGIDHKAGVPKGGTFILVYYEVPAEQTASGAASLTANIRALDEISSATAKATETVAKDSGSRSSSLAPATVISSGNMKQILDLFDSKDLQLTSAQASRLKQLAVSKLNLAALGLQQQFRIPDKAVVADFYLPYLCCSDCAPIAYVFPKATVAISVNLDRTEYCNNDENTYSVSVSPDGGKLTDSLGGIPAGTTQFKPKGLATGTDKITYTLSDGRSSSIDVKIVAAPVVDFTSAAATAPNIIIFKATGIDNKTVSWDFGDSTAASTLASPVHTYQFDGDSKTFTVTLTVKDGPCTVSVKHDVTITKAKPQVFTIDPKLYCSKDDRSFKFTINPVADITAITNPNGLVMDKDATGAISFMPIKQQLTASKQYHLEVKGVGLDLLIVAPDASFNMNITQPKDSATGALLDTILELSAKRTDGDSYSWNVTAGSQVITSDKSKFAISFKERNMEVGIQFKIDLSMGYKVPNVESCIDAREYVLTPIIFRNHIDKGPFDNVTPA